MARLRARAGAPCPDADAELLAALATLAACPDGATDEIWQAAVGAVAIVNRECRDPNRTGNRCDSCVRLVMIKYRWRLEQPTTGIGDERLDALTAASHGWPWPGTGRGTWQPPTREQELAERWTTPVGRPRSGGRAT